MWLDKQNPDDPYNRLKSSTTPLNVGAGAGVEQASGGTSAPSQPAAGPATPAPTAKPQEFASVQDYFKANRQQGEEFGKKVTGKLADTAAKQKADVFGAGESAKQEIQSAVPTENKYLTARAASDPTAIVNDKDQLDKFMQQWNAAYTGPSSFENTQAYQKGAEAVQKSNEKKEQLKSVGGRQQLIQDEFGVYGQGNRGLDEALLQTSSEFPKVQQQEKEFGNLQNYLSQQGQLLAPEVEAARKTAEATRASTRSAVEGGLQKFTTDVDANVKKAQDTVASQTAAVQKALANPQAVNDTVLKALGLTRSEWDNLQYLKNVAAQGWNAPGDQANWVASKNVNLADYFAANPTDVSRRSTVTQADIDKAKAFAALTGNQNILPTVGDKATPGKFTSFDKERATKELEAQRAAIAAAQQKFASAHPTVSPSTGNGVLRSQPVLPANGSSGQSGSNPNPAVNPGIPATGDGKVDPANPTNIQFDNRGNAIIPEGATGVFTPTGGVPSVIPDMTGVQTGNAINKTDLQTVSNQGGTENLPYIGDQTVKQIQDAVKLRTNVQNQDPQTKAQFEAMGNDLSILYARKLAGTLSQMDSMKLNQFATQLGLPQLASSPVPTNLQQYLADQRIAPPAEPKNPDGSTMTAAQKAMSNMQSQLQAKLDSSNYYGKKQLNPMISAFTPLYQKYLDNPAKMTQTEYRNLQQLSQQLGVRI